MRPVLKILTDYPRDDLAHDEVHQALVMACYKRDLDVFNMDVGAVPGMDTVGAGFKIAQLALNSHIGFGHIFHANCAPRKNIVTIKSTGEKVVLGVTDTGVLMLIVNAGYALAPFYDLVKAGKVKFYQTDVPHEGSQFRSRDFFPDALAELALYVSKASSVEGALDSLPWLGDPIEVTSLPQMPAGAVLYTDSFGNIKVNIYHDDLLSHYEDGEVLALRLGNVVHDVVLGRAGFSQGEGMLALTSGSSGWEIEGTKKFFTEIFLRGGAASKIFGDYQSGDPIAILREDDLKHVIGILREAGAETANKLGLHNITEANVVSLLVQNGLIVNACDSAPLHDVLLKGDVLKTLVS